MIDNAVLFLILCRQLHCGQLVDNWPLFVEYYVYKMLTTLLMFISRTYQQLIHIDIHTAFDRILLLIMALSLLINISTLLIIIISYILKD